MGNKNKITFNLFNVDTTMCDECVIYARMGKDKLRNKLTKFIMLLVL